MVFDNQGAGAEPSEDRSAEYCLQELEKLVTDFREQGIDAACILEALECVIAVLEDAGPAILSINNRETP